MTDTVIEVNTTSTVIITDEYESVVVTQENLSPTILETLAGTQGVPGPAPVLNFLTPVTGAAGSNASVSVTGDNFSGYNLTFTIPRGNVGATGPAPNMAIGTVANATPGTTATASITGTNPNYVLNMNIPIANWTIGTVTTVAVGGSATASIGGTALNPTLNLGIPTGATGATGPAPTLNQPAVTTLAPTASPTASFTGSNPYTLQLGLPAAPQWRSGSGVPAGALGNQGDWYQNTNPVGIGDVYEKTGASTWTLRYNIRGASGAGNVSYVNSISPDGTGNVTLTPSNGNMRQAVVPWTPGSGSGNTYVYTDVLNWYLGGAAGTNTGSSIVITTNLPSTSSCMVNIELEISSYIDRNTYGRLQFYCYNNAGGTLHSPSWWQLGEQTVTVRLAKDASNNVVIILDNGGAGWNYPQVLINKIQVNTAGSNASYFQGWTAAYATDLSAYTATMVNMSVTRDVFDSLDNTVNLTGNQTVGGIKTFSSAIMANGGITADGSGNPLSLKPGSADQTFIAMYARTATPGTRSAWIGYGSAGASTLGITNEISGGAINLSTTGNGGINLSSGTGIITLVGPVSAQSGITMAGGTSNLINFGINGIGAPTFTTRSAGTKISLYASTITGSAAEYAIGIEGSYIWQSIPTNTASGGFKWYGGITLAATLTGAGNLTTVGTIDGTNITASGRIGGATGFAGQNTFANVPDGVGSNQTPQFTANSTTFAASSVYTNDGVNNRRSALFVDQTNALWGLSHTASSGTVPFVIRNAGSELLRIDPSGTSTTYIKTSALSVVSSVSNVSAALGVRADTTITSGTYAQMATQMLAIPASSSSAATYNYWAEVGTGAGASNITGGLYGYYQGGTHRGVNNVNNIYGFYANAVNTSTGTITNQYGFYATPAGNGTTNYYGLFVANPGAATNSYSIYTGTAPTYLGGNLTVAGTQTVNSGLNGAPWAVQFTGGSGNDGLAIRLGTGSSYPHYIGSLFGTGTYSGIGTLMADNGTQITSIGGPFRVQTGTPNLRKDVAYTSKSDASKEFAFAADSDLFSVPPGSTFTVGATTYTVRSGYATKIRVVEDISAAPATGTLTGVLYAPTVFSISTAGAATFTGAVTAAQITTSGAGTRLATFTHTSNAAEGVVLQQTAVGGDSPRLFLLRNNESSGNAILRTSAGLIFTYGATPGSASGTTAMSIADTTGNVTFNGTLNLSAVSSASRVLAVDGSKNIAITGVTTTEIAYVSGVTSAIQTQLNGKAATVHTHAAADVTSGVFATARLGTGTADNTKFLRGDGVWTDGIDGGTVV